jgi:NADH:ubiquinone oxidoreductase subunit C
MWFNILDRLMEMEISESDLIRMFKDKWDNLIDAQIQGKRRIFAKITKENCRIVVDFLRKKFNAHLITINILDSNSLFEIIYHFDIQGILLSLKTTTTKLTPQLYTISDIISSAGYYEKEVADSFGLTFIGQENKNQQLIDATAELNVK